ncbi:sigma-70 family rna polymerase sigma factor : RNA polymerase sigma factor, sigma-70 family OS=Singulisphaera acidiphila (strain ATCC BAA-1392 / DSM 18658 / VKM B-2454 / MOB10) GN=Sinac_4459 PE=4 SV=1: Sigma70_r2: Sigma70_r4_2 [Gemmataceae bacterium]|nr:sigma-70 family rna polymerase sigma factor : RNA polymerase sigma factor, sigma-70 family OS=Singulisphaera acidiphila (strain ATCC BAA-1392 / DSM 18658 / VKM B-2454 / MOB10) GN=Sinac_4459 PE=4 SV=1: Sigma70_r2: Sigma70_r4_2 [Gemmataceae bacterium]VTT99641.1 sigma-70 family rna polymerase sigma factor : RNA polymerase sigma factor, sigma-70 family OS=Singulisphaera acidiphila (strain ATCC BAA-1392 / DSM 18658 / VKM B-2454 / MOB10) GN=Sinac_4459 PE=4 SV=1: Sigma70_r2: Sigma70_r4_2 [Gemmataceae 
MRPPRNGLPVSRPDDESTRVAPKAGSLLLNQLRFVVASWREDTRTDAELLRWFAQKRDEQAFGTLVGRHGEMVWGVCFRVLRNAADAEDALQATFLRLARDADRVEARGPLAGWLHRVARACAIDLHRSIARQRRIEGRLAEVANQAGEAQPTDLRVLLDDELSQLPTCERAVLVLICLEGRTYADAAHELGCSTAAVHRRYQQAQARLRQRLARHGPAAVGMVTGGASVLCAPVAYAARPLLLARTVEAGLGVARSGVLPAGRAGWLAAGTTGAVGASLVRALAAAVLVGTVVAAAVLALALPPREPPEPAPAPAQGALAPAPAPVRDRPRGEVAGVVRGADGQPVAGAEVVALARRPFAPGERGLRDEVLERATTDAGGRFALRVSDDFATWFADRVVTVRASAPGLAPASVPVRMGARGDVELRLTGGAVLSGRLVLGSGEPAAGARVEVVRVGCAVSEPVVGAERQRPPGWPEPVRADAEGRFAIPRLGTAENVWVRVADPRFATDTFRLDRPAGDRTAYRVEPAVPLTVEVRAAEGDRPVAGAHVTVITDRLRSHAHFCAADHAILGALTVPADIDAVTGPDGRVRVEVARGDRVEILVHPPAGDEPLVGVRQAVTVGEEPALAPVVRLPAGRWLTGTVTDAGGRGVAGAAVHWGREGATKPEWRDDVLVGRDALTRTDAGGRFRLAVLPGACSVRAHGPTLGHPPVAAQVPGSTTTLFAHHVARIDVPAAGDLPPLALGLPAGAAVTGTVAEAAGANAFLLCSGRGSPVRPYASVALPVRDGRFAVPGCRAGWVTRVYLLDPVAKVGGVVDVSPDAPVPPVKLAPCGTVRVRVVGPDGAPAAGREVTVSLLVARDRRPGEPTVSDPQPTDWFDAANYPTRRTTDAAGVAELTALVPGAEYRIAVHAGTAKAVVGTFTIEPGRTLVLPDVVPTEGETP